MSDLPIFSAVEPDEQATQLRAFYNGLDANMTEESQGLEQDARDLAEKCAVLTKLENDAEVEMVLNSVMSLILILPKESVEQILSKFCHEMSENPAFASHIRYGGPVIRVLSNLFHGFGGPGMDADDRRYLQFEIYCSMLEVAGRTNLVRQVPTDLATVNSWMDAWRLDTDKRRLCLRLLHKSLVAGHQSEAANRVMLQLLSTYTDADAGKAESDATACIKTAIADPGQFIFDHLLGLSPVSNLAGTKIHDLLNIFVNGDLEEYQKFYSLNTSFIDNLPLNHTANMFKMRVLTLLSIGGSQSELPLAEVSKKLQLPPEGEALEEFVIDAIQTGMLKAKIDQLTSKLLISSVRNRTFAKPQWEQLQCRLSQWSSNLKMVEAQLQGLLGEALVK